MKNVKLAVLGLNQGYKFASDAVKMPGVELVAVAGFGDLAVERAKELGVPLYGDYKDLINECELDGVIITLPNQLHREAAELCANKGLHVLVEKPIADTVEDAKAIIAACARNNVELMVGHHRRFSSKLAKLKEMISSGLIGELVGVNMLWALAKDRPYFNDQWRITQGGGPLLLNGIHDVDNLRFTTGLKIESAYAAVRNSIRNNAVEDSASIILETSEGVVANYFISDGIPSPWSYEFDMNENPRYPHYKEDCYYFFGTEGSIAFPSFRVFSYDDEKYGWDHELKFERFTVEDNDPMTAELEHFLSVLRGEARPLVTGEDALETLKVIKAIKESAKAGQKINMNDSALVV